MALSARKYPANKWRKHRIAWADPKLRSYLPETLEYDASQLEEWLTRYKTVYLKPKVGGGGRGIIRVSTWWQGAAMRYLIQTEHGTRKCTSLSQLHEMLQRTDLEGYIMQRGVRLLEVDRRPVDFRVLLGKVEGEWQVFGAMGKVAARGKHVTNVARGGEPIVVADALREGLRLKPAAIREVEAKLAQVSLRTARTLSETFPLLTQLGVDLALDKSRHVFVLEANSRPNYELFRAHPDAELYGRIARWMEAERSGDVL
jgi:glutathione synthase/RimK-type ligase-like ATP-grasp enzyme